MTWNFHLSDKNMQLFRSMKKKRERDVVWVSNDETCALHNSMALKAIPLKVGMHIEPRPGYIAIVRVFF